MHYYSTRILARHLLRKSKDLSEPKCFAAISTPQPPVTFAADNTLHSPPPLQLPTSFSRSLTMSKIELAEVRTTPVVDDDKAYGRDVPIKYRGTETDRLDMSMLGKTQVLRRQFKFWTMLGFASTVMVAWEFCLLVSPFSLEDGGTPAVFWGLIICPFIMMPMYASLAEVSSM